MSLFKRLFKKDLGESYTPVQIRTQHAEGGLHVALSRMDEPVRFPLALSIGQLRQEPQLDLLEAFETLWFDEKLQDSEDGYLIRYEDLLRLEPDVRRVVGVPEPAALELFLSHEGAVGTAHFRFDVQMHEGSWKHLERTAKSLGPWLIMPDRTVLLKDPATIELERLVRQQPDAKDSEQIFAFVAKVRQKALQMGVAMDAYLERQQYLFVDEMELELDYDANGIQVRPAYRSESVDTRVLADMSKQGARFASRASGEKVFVSPQVWEQSRKIKEMPAIQGADIPKFVENPEAFLPDLEQVDLSLFGERVKSLGIRVYRAQPFVHAKETDRGWFQIDIGFSAVDENGEKLQGFQTDEFRQIIHEARENGNEYFEWNGSWLRLPAEAEEFIESSKKLQQAYGSEPKVDMTALPYILEIYDNINQLEYNQPFLHLHQELKDHGIYDKTPPSIFQASLKPFQQEGFVWLKMLHYRKWGGLLADDMGLGKTIQVVSFLAYLHAMEQLTPTLIVVPKTLIENWQKELEKFAPSLLKGLYIHRGTSRLKDPDALRHCGITITTYQTLVRDQLAFGQVDWQAVICDEAQSIKNHSTAASHVMKAMKSKFRLAMTGTPVENGLSELWSIMDYVQPGLLGSLSEFKSEFIAPMEEGEGEAGLEQRLLAKLSSVYKRRTKSEELADQLPAKHHHVVEVPLGDVQKLLYGEVLELVQAKMMDGLQAIQRLKLLSSHPGLLSPEWASLPPSQVPKLAQTLEILKAIQSKGEKALVFTEYRQMQDILRAVIRERFELNPFVINGMTERRQTVVDEFNRRAGFDVLILSPKAAGTGLTITSANHVIHYTRWWNPAVENQATDRAYRIGQDKPVHVYYPLVADREGVLNQGTVEQIVHRILSEKQDLASSIVVSSRKLELESEVLRQFAAG